MRDASGALLKTGDRSLQRSIVGPLSLGSKKPRRVVPGELHCAQEPGPVQRNGSITSHTILGGLLRPGLSFRYTQALLGTHHSRDTVGPSMGSFMPAIYWYGWTVTAALGALVFAASAALLPERLGPLLTQMRHRPTIYSKNN